MSFTEKTIQCADCGSSFAFSIGEQESFATRGFTNDPKRCPTCRAAKRTERGDSGSGSYSSGYQGAAPRQMFPATCAGCGKETQVPFEPRNGRPVYCSPCYSKVRR